MIGDVHFGIKTNNISWLESQLKFFNDQVLPLVPQHDRIIFLGDLFDVRYSVNEQVGVEVKNFVRKLSSYGKEVYFIAGNHDYYSPVVDFENYNAYEVVFGKEFEMIYKNIHFLTNSPLLDNNTLMLPWYYTENEDRWLQMMHDYKNQFNTIYCHSDLASWNNEKISSKGNSVVISGHIHYPYINEDAGLYNVGACCSFTFNDVNSERYIYTIENGQILNKYENVTTPKFYRYFNERIFTLTGDDLSNAYVQLCISTENQSKARYIEKIKEIKYSYVDSNIKIITLDNDEITELLSTADMNTDIHQYIKNNIPDHLTTKYELLNQRLNDSI